MRTLLVVTALMTAAAPIAQAGEPEVFTLEQIKKFMEKKRPCYAARAMVSIPHLAAQKRKDIVAPQVICMADLVVDVGTINEQKGCGIAVYNVNEGEFYKPGSFAAGVPCQAGGAEKVNTYDPMLRYSLKTYFDGKLFPWIYGIDDYATCNFDDNFYAKKKDCSALKPKNISEKIKAMFGGK